MPEMKFNSPARRWDVLASLMQSAGLKTFVEVGCKEGRTTGFILKSIPDAEVWAIDPWAPVGNDAEDYEAWDYDQIQRAFYKNVEGHNGRLEILQMLSLEAAAALEKQDPERKFDLVFIDAAHDQANVEADIDAWWPLVKPGGYLAGHDYQHKFPGVHRAVANRFPLIVVSIFPDSVWLVQKGEA